MNGSSSTIRMRVSMEVPTLRSTTKRQREGDRGPTARIVRRELAAGEPRDVLGGRPFDRAQRGVPDPRGDSGHAHDDHLARTAQLRRNADLELAAAVHRA